LVSRRFGKVDKICSELQHMLDVLAGPSVQRRINPAKGKTDGPWSESEKRHVAGLMRINATGEISAQGLYRGQAAATQHNKHLKQQLLQAAEEERDHLAWCAQRLQQLQASRSYFDPIFYLGSWLLGFTAGSLKPKQGLGFIEETERQVAQHLQDHLQALPRHDKISKSIIQKMLEEEIEHAHWAKENGAVKRSSWVKKMMSWMAWTMKKVAYRI
jgi:3-demethoxyubiquinol 3-hydroxylase